MPLIVAERDWDHWLDRDAPPDPDLLARLPDVHAIRMREISTLVNNVRNNGPRPTPNPHAARPMMVWVSPAWVTPGHEPKCRAGADVAGDQP
jgi:hypothetical protein